MALLKCPECGKEVSEYADACPNCGCPMSKIQELLAEESDPAQDQPPTGGYSFINNESSPTVQQTAQTQGYAANNQEERPQVNIPRCPTCGSTNIEKIKTSSKVLNAALFGFYGNKRRMQYHCNDCGYEW